MNWEKQKEKTARFLMKVYLVILGIAVLLLATGTEKWMNVLETGDTVTLPGTLQEEILQNELPGTELELPDPEEELVFEDIFLELELPFYDGEPYVVVNDNVPFFTEEEKSSRDSFEVYSELDSLGRCGSAYANISRELQPTEEREAIGHIKPTGWNQAKYEGYVNSSPPYLYNRCHLIAFCLTAENDNEKNLITGTRYMNVEGMLPFETQVDRYLEENDHHVLYRVTPFYEGDNLLADGVLIEAYSVEDEGEGINFCVFVYNVQPGIELDYATGESAIAETL